MEGPKKVGSEVRCCRILKVVLVEENLEGDVCREVGNPHLVRRLD